MELRGRQTSSNHGRFSGRRRAGVAAAAISALTLTLAACGQTDDSDNEAANRECPKIADKPAKGNGTIKYWSMWTKGEPQMEVLQKTFDCFTKETGIKVEAEWFGRTVLTENVAPALNTGDVPDLIDQDSSQVNAAVGAPGGLQGVDDVLDMKVSEGDKTVGDVMSKVYYDLPANKLKDGSLMLVPYETLSTAWWYDAKNLTDVTPPETTEDLFALFDAAKESETGAVSQDGDIDFYNAYFYSVWAEQYVGAGGLLKAAQDKTGESWKTEPGLTEAAKLVERLAKGKYLIDGWDASKFPNVQNRWADGEAGFLYVGSWITSEAGEYLKTQGGDAAADKAEFKSFGMPLADGATHKTVEQLPIGFGVTKDAANADAAKALIAYALNKQNIEPISTVADNLVPREDVEAPPALAGVKAALDDPSAEPVIFMDGIDGQAPDWTKEVFYPLNNKLLKGEITADEFITQIAAGTKKFYA